MFQFRRFPSYSYLIHCRIPCGGFPHSEISGSMLICSSPKLIAAYHGLHRLLMPRHSPCALFSLTNKAFALQVLTIKKSPYWFSITVELCRLILEVYFSWNCGVTQIWLNKFPFMLPSHNCIIITMFSFQGANSSKSKSQLTHLTQALNARLCLCLSSVHSNPLRWALNGNLSSLKETQWSFAIAELQSISLNGGD